MFVSTSASHAAVLLNGDFENGLTNWNTFGEVSAETSPATLINGTQALKMFGNFTDQQSEFSVASQYVAVDGTDFSVGDQIVLSGLMGHLSGDAIIGENTAYLEIAFAFNDFDINAVDFDNAVTSVFFDSSFATDTFFAVNTTSVSIPDLVFGEEIKFIRVAAAFRQPNNLETGAAWFDDLSLNVVPAPSSLAILLLAFISVSLLKRR